MFTGCIVKLKLFKIKMLSLYIFIRNLAICDNILILHNFSFTIHPVNIMGSH